MPWSDRRRRRRAAVLLLQILLLGAVGALIEHSAHGLAVSAILGLLYAAIVVLATDRLRARRQRLRPDDPMDCVAPRSP